MRRVLPNMTSCIYELVLYVLAYCRFATLLTWCLQILLIIASKSFEIEPQGTPGSTGLIFRSVGYAFINFEDVRIHRCTNIGHDMLIVNSHTL